MSTEYRRGIPSTAHVEAATRLELLWHASDGFYHRFRGNRDAVEVQFALDRATLDTRSWYKPDGHLSRLSFRPIRPDGTPVDWEVLDQEVARVGQQGQPAIVTPTTAPTQPQGFRVDLWARIIRHFSLVFRSHNQVSNLTELSSIDDVGIHSPNWQWGWGTADRETPTRQNRADILARWAVYQELKPLYDLVDGAQGEAAMPRDVEAEWDRQSLGSAYNFETDGDWVFGRDSLGVFARSAESDVWRAGALGSQVPLRNFTAVLDAVAERRVAERMRGQTQAQDTILINPEHDALVASRLSQRARSGRTVMSTQPAQPEPRRFADVRPDRHGWRWWRIVGRRHDKVRPMVAPPRIAKPAAAPRRPAIEVVDAEVDGLSCVDVVTALVGRALNGGC